VAAPDAAQAPPGRWQALSVALGKQRHLGALRDGVVGALPLILVGSLFLLLAQPPSEGLAKLLLPYQDLFKVPFRMLGGVLSLYVAFGCAHSLAKSYGMDGASAGLLAVAAFLCAQSTAPLAPPLTGWGLPGDRLGAPGMFGAMALALGSVEVSRFFKARNWTLRLPPTAPPAIAQSFAALLPTLLVVTGVWGGVHVVGVDLLGAAGALARPLLKAGDSLPAAWGVALLDSGMWLLGLHPSAAMAALKPVWLQMLAENMAAADLHQPLPHLGGHEFFIWFVWQGGSGGTLGVALLLLRARSATLKGVGKLALVPALFNINEPLLFGLPIVLNGSLAAPFIAAPLVTSTLTWLAMHADLVAKPRLEVLWTLPAPLGAYLTTGGDWRAVVLGAINLGVTMAIYWPFLRRYDRALLAKEQAAEAAPAPT
jgi:PTS system cellobiose-specific IIC component